MAISRSLSPTDQFASKAKSILSTQALLHNMSDNQTSSANAWANSASGAIQEGIAKVTGNPNDQAAADKKKRTISFAPTNVARRGSERMGCISRICQNRSCYGHGWRWNPHRQRRPSRRSVEGDRWICQRKHWQSHRKHRSTTIRTRSIE